jgi:hypothetical protein
VGSNRNDGTENRKVTGCQRPDSHVRNSPVDGLVSCNNGRKGQTPHDSTRISQGNALVRGRVGV